LDLCVPHECHCGSKVDVRGVHSFVCKRAPGRTSRHHAFNDLVARAFSSAGFPVTLGFVQIRWQAARWPHTCSLVERQSAMLGCHSNMSTGWLIYRCSRSRVRRDRRDCRFPQGREVRWRYIFFEPIAIDTLGVLNTSARQLLCDLGRKISEHSQRNELSVSKVLGARATFQCPRQFTRLWLHRLIDRIHFVLSVIFKSPRDHIYRGSNNNNNNK